MEMKKILLTMVMALTGLCWTACGPQTPEEMLVGRWRLHRVVETVASTAVDTVATREMEGYDATQVEFMEGGLCVWTQRTDTTHYHWMLGSDMTLVLMRGTQVDDYHVDKLTENRLVYSHAYSHRDSLSGVQYDYSYSFEYNKK